MATHVEVFLDVLVLGTVILYQNCPLGRCGVGLIVPAHAVERVPVFLSLWTVPATRNMDSCTDGHFQGIFMSMPGEIKRINECTKRPCVFPTMDQILDCCWSLSMNKSLAEATRLDTNENH